MTPDKALLRHAQISAMPQPNADDVKALCEWIKLGGCGDDAIEGKCSCAWGDINAADVQSMAKLSQILQLLGVRECTRKEDKKGVKTLVKTLVKTHPCKKLDIFTWWLQKGVVPFWKICTNKRMDVQDPDFVSLCLWKVDIDTNAACRTR